MARITPIDVIKGISGKYGSGSSDYFATNSSSNRIHLAKYLNKPTGPATQEQLAQMSKFGTQQKMAAAWLRANRPSEVNGTKGTIAYQEAQALKKSAHLSNVRQIVLKYMDEDGNVTLPSSGTSNDPAAHAEEKFTLTLSASPSTGGSVTGAGQYAKGAQATIKATAKSGYTFTRWSDGNTNAERTLTISGDLTLQAIFTANSGSGESQPGGGSEVGQD